MTFQPAKPTVVQPVVVAGPASSPRVLQARGPVTVAVRDDGSRVWSGEGAPPPPGAGVAVGDTYVDLVTGNVYRLDPGE